MQTSLNEARKSASGNLFRFLFNGACIGLGVSILLGHQPNAIFNYFCYSGIGCLPSAWKWLGTDSQSNDLFEWVMSIFLRLVFAFILGGIIAPFVLLGSLGKYFKANSDVEKFKRKIKEFQA